MAVEVVTLKADEIPAAKLSAQNLSIPVDPFNFAVSKLRDSLTKVQDSPTQSLISALFRFPRIQDELSSQSRAYNLSEVQQLLTHVGEWNWKLFEFSEACPGGKPLFILAWHVFEVNGLLEEFSLPLDKFGNFIWTIQQGYRQLPYHNSIHAADVLHAVNYFTQFDQVSSIVSPLELMALYLAAAVHDFDHPGVNNNFLISTCNNMAVLYNDRTVLESYHLSSAFFHLLTPENNFLKNLPKADWQYLREVIIETVLATDLSMHYAILSQFKTRVQSSFNPGQSKDDRILLFKMLMKCADVSNPVKEFGIYSKWIDRVLEEWRGQGDMERKLGLPISPFMDRENPNVLLSSQSGFIDFIIVPMYEALHLGFLNLPAIMQELDRNRSHWQKLKEQKERETQTATSPSVMNSPTGPNSVQPSATSNMSRTSILGWSLTSKAMPRKNTISNNTPSARDEKLSPKTLRALSSTGDLTSDIERAQDSRLEHRETSQK